MVCCVYMECFPHLGSANTSWLHLAMVLVHLPGENAPDLLVFSIGVARDSDQDC